MQTVRFYEREGLLEEPWREASGYRNHDARHLTRLNFIRHCRSLDIPLAEVRLLLDFAPSPSQSCASVHRLLDEHIALVKNRISAVCQLDAQLVSLRQTCDADASHPCAILESFMSAAQELSFRPSDCALRQPSNAQLAAAENATTTGGESRA